MTDNPTPNDVALLREAKAREVLAGEIEKDLREDGTSEDVIAVILDDTLNSPLWGLAYKGAAIRAMLEFAALAPGQHDGAAGEGLAWTLQRKAAHEAARLRAIPMTEWVWGDALRIFAVLDEAAKPAPTEQARAEGYVLVPREPTEAMLLAAVRELTLQSTYLGWEPSALWSAMLVAAGDDAVGGGDE